jgi:hypothetical protein
MDKLKTNLFDIQGMPQNILSQLLGYAAFHFDPDGKIKISIDKVSEITGCIVYVEGMDLIVQGFKNN